MPLILAIEPNNSQAQQLTALVRQYLQAELIAAPSAKAALQALGTRIPDLVLTPALLAPKDEAALTERLRELGNAAAHVQTLAVPILASAKSKPMMGGILGRKRDRTEASEPVGCHPSVFAEQIEIYLERAASERDAAANGGAAVAAAGLPPPASDPSAGHDDAPVDDDTLDVIFDLPVDPLAPEPPPVPVRNPSPAGASTHTAVTAAFDPTELVKPVPSPGAAGTAVSERRTDRGAAHPPRTHLAEADFGLPGAPAGSPPLWRIAEDIEDFYRGTASFAPGVETGEESAEQATDAARLETAPGEPLPEPAAGEKPQPDGLESDDTVLEVDLDAALLATASPTADPAGAFVVDAAGHGHDQPRVDEASPADRGAHHAASTGHPAPPAPQKASRKRKAGPPSDDWIAFDPSQSPFKALVRRLDEIAGHGAAST